MQNLSVYDAAVAHKMNLFYTHSLYPNALPNLFFYIVHLCVYDLAWSAHWNQIVMLYQISPPEAAMAQKNYSMSLKPKQRHCKRAFLFCLHWIERPLPATWNVDEAAFYRQIFWAPWKIQIFTVSRSKQPAAHTWCSVYASVHKV